VRRLDVSMPLYAGMPGFPGDPEFSSRPVHSLAKGDPYSVSGLSLGSHSGTHVDPPCHFLPGAATVDRLDLEVLNGPCRVVEVPESSRSIGPGEVSAVPPGTTRVLFRTPNSARWHRKLEFFPDYVAVDDAGAEALLARRVGLVGIDSLSVERDSTGRFPVHHRLLGGGALILEGLLLYDAPAGSYDLECLPLLLRGGDGGPARVVLRSP
jgi:arylformamidase